MMKMLFSFTFMILSISCSAQLTDEEVYDLKSDRKKDDTSYIYWLPYRISKNFFLIQASNSKMSHHNELSLDFKMRKGSIICASREGTIIAARYDSDKGD